MGFVSYVCLDIFDNYLNLDTLMGIFLQGFFAGVVGILTAVAVLYLLKSEELKEIWSTLHHKIWKATVIAPDADPS